MPPPVIPVPRRGHFRHFVYPFKKEVAATGNHFPPALVQSRPLPLSSRIPAPTLPPPPTPDDSGEFRWPSPERGTPTSSPRDGASFPPARSAPRGCKRSRATPPAARVSAASNSGAPPSSMAETTTTARTWSSSPSSFGRRWEEASHRPARRREEARRCALLLPAAPLPTPTCSRGSAKSEARRCARPRSSNCRR